MVKAIALLVVLLLIFVTGNVNSENLTSENDFLEHNNRTLKEMPEDIKKTFYEEVDPKVMKLIESKKPPNKKLIESGFGNEKFEGEIYVLYHEFGAVDISRGSTQIILPNDTINVGAEKDRITIGYRWDTDYLHEMGLDMGAPPLPPPVAWELENTLKNETINKRITTYINQTEYASENKTEMPENKKTYPDNSIKNYIVILFVLLVIISIILIVFRRK